MNWFIEEYQEQANNPQFEKTGRVHDWRNHITEEIREAWSELSLETRRCAIHIASEAASNEEWD